MYLDGSRPNGLGDLLIDFSYSNKFQFGVTLISSGDPTIQTNSTKTTRNYNYYILQEGRTAFTGAGQKISQSGDYISTGYTWSDGVSSLVGMDGTAPQTRKFPQAGYFYDKIVYTVQECSPNFGTTGGVQSSQTVNQYSNCVNNLYYSDFKYFVFAKASVVNMFLDGVFATGGSNNVVSKTQGVAINSSAFFSPQLKNSTVQLQYNNNGVWTAAVLNTDYSFVNNAQTQFTGDDDFILLQQGSYRIIYTANGYHSLDNPYVPVGTNFSDYQWQDRNVVTSNSDVKTVYINTGVPTTTTSITLPKIETNISVNSPVASTDPTINNATYQNSQVAVTANVRYETGQWLVNGVAQTISNDQWDAELAATCDVTLHVQKDGVDVITPLQGYLNQHVISLPSEGAYKINYITTLK